MAAHAIKPLIGRDDELALIDQLLEELEGGSSAVLYVVGEPGIGKTALLSEAVERGATFGHTMLSGRAAEFERDLPFGVFSDALDPHLGLLEPAELERLVGDPGPLATAFPSLRLLPRAATGGSPDERHVSLWIVRALLDRLGNEGPLVIGLDDLHWADPASVDLICHILHRPLENPLLFLLAARPYMAVPRLMAALEEAERRGSGQRIELHPLSAAEAGELLGDSIDPALGDHLYLESGGNPFYLEQLASAVKRGKHAAALRESDPGQAVPRAVTAAIVDEIEGLSSGAKRFVHGAAVAGESFEPDLAAEIADISKAEALEMLDEVVSRDLIRPTAVPRRFRFRHPIVRHAVYESVGGGRALAAHGRAAAALASRNAPASARAHHVERSASLGDTEAVGVLRLAGEESASHAPASAAHWFEAALRVLPPSEEHEQLRLELMTRRAAALGVAGYLEEARDALRQLLKLLSPELTPVRRQAVLVAEVVEDVLGNHDDCERMLMQELSNVSDLRSIAAMEIATALSINCFFRNDWTAMREWADRALAGEASSSSTRLSAFSTLAIAEYVLGHLDVAEQATSDAAALFDGLSDSDLAARNPGVAIWLGWAEICAERLDDAIRHLDRAVAVSRTTGQRHLIPAMLAFQLQPLVMKGRFEDAGRNADAVTELALLMETDRHRQIAMTMRSAIEVVNGDLYAAVRFAEHGVVDPTKDDPATGLSRLVLADALLEIGEPERALDALLATDGTPRLPQIPFCECYGYLLLTRAELGRNGVDQADVFAGCAEDLAARYPRLVPRGSAAQARAMVLLAKGDVEGACERAGIAVECAEGLGSAVSAGHARILFGTALEAAGDRPRAIIELESAYAELGSSGALRYQDVAAAALRKLGRAVPRRTTNTRNGAFRGLSKREIQVLSLIGQGMTNRQIAAELYLSVRTVDRHVSRIFDKLGVSSRAAAASMFERFQAQRSGS